MVQTSSEAAEGLSTIDQDQDGVDPCFVLSAAEQRKLPCRQALKYPTELDLAAAVEAVAKSCRGADRTTLVLAVAAAMPLQEAVVRHTNLGLFG